MNELVESIFLKTKDAYKESVVIDNEKLQDILITILADVKKLKDLSEEIEYSIPTTHSKEKVSTRYTYDQVKGITKIQVQLAKDLISFSTAEDEILNISSTFPVRHLKQYNKRLKNYLSGIGEHGFGFPSNWAKALLEETHNDPLVVKAFRHQQELYLKKQNRVNKKLEAVLDNL